MEPANKLPAVQTRQIESISDLSLQASLHATTRSKHANLNKTITNRLPLCLPPHATTPLPYHLGMLAFGMIYQQLERAIGHVKLEQPEASLRERLRHIDMLERLSTEGLERTQSLKHDNQLLHERLSNSRQLSVDALEALEKAVRSSGEACTAQIYKRIIDKPYLALAYSWTMYLALFNGGRWLLKQLESAGPDFWLEDGQRDSAQRSVAVLSFWHFEAATTEDPNADQLKMTFKQNFDLASSLLTNDEAAEVVQEGITVFDTCSELIEALDSSVQGIEKWSITTQLQSTSTENDKEESVFPMWQKLESSVLVPAYQIVRRIWSQSPRSEVTVVAG